MDPGPRGFANAHRAHTPGIAQPGGFSLKGRNVTIVLALTLVPRKLLSDEQTESKSNIPSPTPNWHSHLRSAAPPRVLARFLSAIIQSLKDRRLREEADASTQERIADAITRFTGSRLFAYLHLGVFGFWIVANLGWIPGVPQWDESFVVLAMIASVEAIFLSTFVLISQNRMAAAANKRADLDLQISLLAEHEITKLATLVAEIASHVGVRTKVDSELEEIKQDVAPEAVLDELEAAGR